MDRDNNTTTNERPTRTRRQTTAGWVLELALVALFTGVTVWVVMSSALPPEVRPLAKIYGPDRNSENSEEWIIRDFFKDRRDGVFVDVGANHYRFHSNTYYLETILGWSGIAVEPLAGFEPDYRLHRPRTRFRPFFVSDVSNSQATMYLLGGNPLVTSSDKSFTERHGVKAEELTVPTITLTDLLTAEKVFRVDFLNMDIELSEPKALAGFDVQRFKPELVCIEAHPEVRQQILDYFAQRDYVLLGRYLRADEHNLYFTPLSSGGQPNPGGG